MVSHLDHVAAQFSFPSPNTKKLFQFHRGQKGHNNIFISGPTLQITSGNIFNFTCTKKKNLSITYLAIFYHQEIYLKIYHDDNQINQKTF